MVFEHLEAVQTRHRYNMKKLDNISQHCGLPTPYILCSCSACATSRCSTANMFEEKQRLGASCANDEATMPPWNERDIAKRSFFYSSHTGELRGTKRLRARLDNMTDNTLSPRDSSPTAPGRHEIGLHFKACRVTRFITGGGWDCMPPAVALITHLAGAPVGS